MAQTRVTRKRLRDASMVADVLQPQACVKERANIVDSIGIDKSSSKVLCQSGSVTRMTKVEDLGTATEDQSLVETPRACTDKPNKCFSSLSKGVSVDWKINPRYEIQGMLGHGSYGEVARAFDRDTKRKVAIKRIPGLFNQVIDSKRIFRETHILRHLNHNNVIRLLDVSIPSEPDFNEIYLVFEYMDTDLYKLIKSPQYLSIDHVRSFLYQMLCAVRHIHSAGVIHRDLKPANILLNEDCSLKICDFGLSRVFPTHEISSFPNEVSDAKKEKSRNTSKVLQRRIRTRNGVVCTTPEASDANTEPEKRMKKNLEETTKETQTGVKNNAEMHRRLARSMTRHVITRWYRPPELILLQDYSSIVDLWSIGCIFAELLGMQKGSVKSYMNRSALFPGKSCFPLSANSHRSFKDRRDQLNVIFNVIGTPNDSDIENLGGVEHYLKGLDPKPRIDFSKKYSAAPPSAIDLLNRMLVFDPSKRITIDEALNHEFLSPVRVEKLEKVDAPGFPEALKPDLSREEMRALFRKEADFYKKKSR